jgi:hypothetical protein
MRSKIRRSSDVILRLKTLVKIRSIGNGPRLTLGKDQETDSAVHSKSQFANATSARRAIAIFQKCYSWTEWTRNIGARSYLL